MNKRSRVSIEQRERLLEYMMGHEGLARGRVTGVDAARKKTEMLNDMTTILNGLGVGATKTPEKWWKCWQDWKSDVKAKALKVKKQSAGTGGGPAPSPLTKLEEALLQFCGVEMVQGVRGVPDPLEIETDNPIEYNPTPEIPEIEAEIPDFQILGDVGELPTKDCLSNRRKDKYDLQASLDRQAAAIETLCTSMQAMSTGMQALATSMKDGQADISAALRSIAEAIEKQPKYVFENEAC